MKIVYLMDSLNRGGAETLALDVCRNAKNNGLDIIFVATGGGLLEDDFRVSGVEFIRLNRRLPLDIGLVAKIRKILTSRAIDIIHVHQAVEAIHAYSAAFGTKTKIVFTHHGFIPDNKNLYALKFLLTRIDQNIVCSKALLEWYQTETKLNFPANTQIIQNGVDPDRITAPAKEIRDELAIPEKATLFGMIGNFYRDPRKDQLTLCKALPKIITKIPDAYCIFVGKTEPGGEAVFEECRSICESNNLTHRVIFAGSRNDIPYVLKSLDIFVLSSLHEGFPISVLEAMLSGTPCLLSDIKPNLEISKSGVFAEVFETQNENELADKLIRLANDKEFMFDLAIRAKNFANREYSIDSHLNKLKRLYESVIL